jgi:hypothetical protein
MTAARNAGFMRRLHLHLLLALLLVFTQQVGAAHLSSHAASQLAQPHGKAHGTLDPCELCSLFASLGHGLPASSLSWDVVPSHFDSVESVAHSLQSRTLPAYQSRAPPAYL